jgi:hypothetical protein
LNGKSEQETQNLWASENIDMKVFIERTNTVSTTTTLNSKSFTTSPTPSYNNSNFAENGTSKLPANNQLLVTKINNESDKLIT